MNHNLFVGFLVFLLIIMLVGYVAAGVGYWTIRFCSEHFTENTSCLIGLGVLAVIFFLGAAVLSPREE